MNYHQARQRTDGKWAWTTMNDGRISTSGGCVTWPEGQPETIEEAVGPNRKPIGEPHAHETREEAERCFYDYEAGRLREHSGPEAERHRCEWAHTVTGTRCENWTSKWLEPRLLGGMSWLCDEHRTAWHWRALHPFTPNISITASW